MSDADIVGKDGNGSLSKSDGITGLAGKVNKAENNPDKAKKLLSALSSSDNPIEQIKKLLQYSDSVLRRAFSVPGRKAILFDLDGTLFDTDSVQKNGWAIAAKKLCLTVAGDEQDSLRLAATAYDHNEAIEKNLFHPYVNIRKVWNTEVHYAVVLFLDMRAKKLGSVDKAVEEFKTALSSDDRKSKIYKVELDKFLTSVVAKKAPESVRIKAAQQAFDNYCNTQVKLFDGVRESLQLLKKLGFLMVITSDGDRDTQVAKVHSWFKLRGLFPATHIICTSDAYPQEEMGFLRGQTTELRKRLASNEERTSQVDLFLSDMLEKYGDMLSRKDLAALPSYRKLKQQTIELEAGSGHNSFLLDMLNRLTTKQRLDFYKATIRAIAIAPDDPAGWMSKPNHKQAEPIKVCSIGDSHFDVGIHALDQNILVVGVLTGKQKYRGVVTRLLSPSLNPELQNPRRVMIAPTLPQAMPFIVDADTWNAVDSIHNIRQTVAPVVSRDDAVYAMRVIAESKMSMSRRIAATIALEGGSLLRDIPDTREKDTLLRRFRSVRNPVEQVAYASLLGHIWASKQEKDRFAEALADRLHNLSPNGTITALQSLAQIGRPQHLQAIKRVLAESRYEEIKEAATIAEAAVRRATLDRSQAVGRFNTLMDSSDKVSSLRSFHNLVGQLKSLKREYDIPLQKEQASKLLANHRRLRSL